MTPNIHCYSVGAGPKPYGPMRCSSFEGSTGMKAFSLFHFEGLGLRVSQHYGRGFMRAIGGYMGFRVFSLATPGVAMGWTRCTKASPLSPSSPSLTAEMGRRAQTSKK